MNPDMLRAIREAPEDDTPRLVYADWLQERGDPRGELIAVQCALHGLSPADPRRAKLEGREEELLDAHEARWRAELPLRRGVALGPFVRGFVGSAESPGAAPSTRRSSTPRRSPPSSCGTAPTLRVTMTRVSLRWAAPSSQRLSRRCCLPRSGPGSAGWS